MKKIFTAIYILIIWFFSMNNLSAQCCSGEFIVSLMLQSGVDVGYGIQFFDPAGFNNYIERDNFRYVSTSISKMEKFGTAHGFTFGANIIQFHLEDFFIGFKVNYNQMKENKSGTASISSGGKIEREFDLTLTSFGIGFETSLKASRKLYLKFLDAMLTWNSAKLEYKYSDPFTTSEQKLESPGNNIGLSAGAGVLFYPLPPYISVEATCGYAFFSIPEMQFAGGELLAETPDGGSAMKNFIKSGGIFALLQVNLAAPF